MPPRNSRSLGPVVALALVSACGSSASEPAPEPTPPPTSAAPPASAIAPPSPRVEAPPPSPAPTLCVRAAECCDPYLAALGVTDTAARTAACAPFAAPVTDESTAHYRCARQLDLWQRGLEGLGQAPSTECVVRDAWRNGGPSWTLLTQAESDAVDSALHDARAAMDAGHAEDARARLDPLVASGRVTPELICESGWAAHLAGDDAAASTRIAEAVLAFGTSRSDATDALRARCLFRAGAVHEALHETEAAASSYLASERVYDDPATLARLAALGRAAPGQLTVVRGVEVESGPSAITVRSGDLATVEAVMGDAFARYAFHSGPGPAARITSHTRLELPAGGAFVRAVGDTTTRYADPDSEPAPMQVLVLLGANESRLVTMELDSNDTITSVGPIAITLEGERARLSWTVETHPYASRSFDWEGHEGVHCVEAFEGERRSVRWEALCDLGAAPRCTYAPVAETETPDPAPTTSCTDASGQPTPGPAPSPSDAPDGLDRRPVSLTLSAGPDGAPQLVDAGGADAAHPTDLGSRLHTSSGSIDGLADDASRAEYARRDPALAAAEEAIFPIGFPDAVIELPDFAVVNVDEGSGAWVTFLARESGGWVELDRTTDHVTPPQADVTEGGARSGVPLALDLVPGGASELLIPLSMEDSEWRPCRDELVVCGLRDTHARCRAIALRTLHGRQLARALDALRFDLAGHVFVTTHGGAEEQLDLAAWLAEDVPEAEGADGTAE